MEGGTSPLAFTVRLTDFNQAVEYLLAGRSQGEAQLDFVDLNARGSEVELATTSTSSTFPAEIKTTGYARVPIQVFERVSRAARMLRQPSALVTVKPGKIRVATMLVSHPEIEIRLIGARIADLPMGVPLPDVLAFLTHLRPEEIEDSGLLARVLAAQEEASRLIDRAFESLELLGIERAALSRFVSEQMELRSRKKG
jgi:hypothetical protein